MRAYRISIIIVLLLTMALWFSACESDEEDDDDKSGGDDDATDDDDSTADDDDTTDDDDDDWPENDHIEQGKIYLEASAAGLARLEFEAALGEVPGHPDAYYGLILANSLHEFDVVSVVVSYIEMFLGFNEPDSKEDDNLEDLLNTLLDEVMDGMFFIRHEQLMDSWDDWKHVDPEREFELTKMPIILNFKTVAEPGGLYDYTEGLASTAVTQMLTGLIHHLTSINADMDLSYIFQMMDIDFGSYSTTEVVSIVVDILLALINAPGYPDFLTLGQDGVEEMQGAGLMVGLGFLTAHETIEAMYTDMGPREVLGFADFNDNGQIDVGESYTVPGFGLLDSDQEELLNDFDQLFYSLAQSFLDHTQYDLDPNNVTPFNLSGLNTLLKALGLPSLIPDLDMLDVDFGGLYLNADTNFIKNELNLILNLLALVLPPPPPY